MLKIFELIGRYFILMGKVFSRPEKRAIYRRRIIYEMESLGLNSIGLTAIISVFIGAVITLQMSINLESPFIPKYIIGYATRETMILEFSSTVVALILAGKVGSSIASEIGTMRITEQIDALEIMGVNSASYLILPKIVAAVVFFPFLTILSIAIGTISGMQLDGTKFFYINQLEANPGMPTNAYGEEEYTPERIGWYDCACCPPNLARLMTSLGSYVWSSSEDTIYSHLFVGGMASFETAGGVKIALTSKYPWNGSVTYTVEPEQAGAEFTLAVRYPGWCHQMQVKVNGIPVSGAVKTDKGYWMIQRSWQPGDTVSCEMEMEPERVYAHPMVRADAGCVALRRGPIIYTFEGVDNGEDLQTLRIPREAKIEVLPYQADLLEGIVALRVTGCRKKAAVNPALYAEDAAPEEVVTLQAIPYYAWCNRGMTHMRVWMQE